MNLLEWIDFLYFLGRPFKWQTSSVALAKSTPLEVGEGGFCATALLVLYHRLGKDFFAARCKKAWLHVQGAGQPPEALGHV